jgi:hypothetical protein
LSDGICFIQAPASKTSPCPTPTLAGAIRAGLHADHLGVGDEGTQDRQIDATRLGTDAFPHGGIVVEGDEGFASPIRYLYHHQLLDLRVG